MEKRRSVGVTACGILMFLFGFLFFYYSRAFLALKQITALCYLVGLIYIISSIGVLFLKNWSRILAVYTSVLALLVSTISVINIISTILSSNDPHVGFLAYLLPVVGFPILPSLWFLSYLTRPKVKRQFMEPNPDRPKRVEGNSFSAKKNGGSLPVRQAGALGGKKSCGNMSR